MAQVVEHLPSKCEALSSNPQHCNKKQTKNPQPLPLLNATLLLPPFFFFFFFFGSTAV
jgi:hypothetical protein